MDQCHLEGGFQGVAHCIGLGLALCNDLLSGINEGTERVIAKIADGGGWDR